MATSRSDRHIEISVSVNPAQLGTYEDEFLAFAWHLAQHNPAPYGDREATELVEAIGWEIIRRWLRGVRPEMYRHQPKSHYWNHLTRLARYEPPQGVDPFDPEWGSGEWVVREINDPATEAATSTETADQGDPRGTGTEGGFTPSAA